VAEGVYLVDADESVADLFDTLVYEDPEQDEELINTLMGEWAYEQFPSIPKAGDSFRYHQIHVTVKTMVHNRIMKLQVTILPEETEGGEAE
jgi:CBS domain containing-hemolysin-like protein